MKSPIVKALLAVLCVLAVLPVSAGGKITLRACAPAQAAAGATFRVEFTVNARSDDGSFAAPSFGGCEIVAGPMLARGSTFGRENGEEFSSVQTTYAYKLVRRTEGCIAVGAAEISVGGKRYRSKPVRIEVTDEVTLLQNGMTPAEVVFKAVVPKSVTAGESFRAEFTLNATPDENSFVAPVFEGCEQLAGPMFSSSRVTKAGKTAEKMTCSYVLVRRTEGRIAIGAAWVSVGGKKYDTQPLTVATAPQAAGGTAEL